MNLFNLVDHFITDESGAVPADWVVLTAAVAMLGIAVIAPVTAVIVDLGNSIAAIKVAQ